MKRDPTRAVAQEEEEEEERVGCLEFSPTWRGKTDEETYEQFQTRQRVVGSFEKLFIHTVR